MESGTWPDFVPFLTGHAICHNKDSDTSFRRDKALAVIKRAGELCLRPVVPISDDLQLVDLTRSRQL